MKTLATLALGFGLAIATPATAQVMGSTNRNAPTCTHIMEFAGGAKITVQYKAITWASGKWAENLEQMKGFINSSAARSPMGEVHADADFTFGGKTMSKGKYKIYFTLTDKLDWVLNAENKDGKSEPVTWELKMEKKDAKQTRLGMTFVPTEKHNVGHMQLAFGPMGCEVPFMPAPMTDKSE